MYMSITEKDLQLWKKDSLKTAEIFKEYLGVDLGILERISKNVGLEIVPTDHKENTFGYTELFNNKIYAFSSNISDKLPSPYNEIVNQSAIDYHLMGQIYNFHAYNDSSEKNAIKNQFKMAECRSKENGFWGCFAENFDYFTNLRNTYEERLNTS